MRFARVTRLRQGFAGFSVLVRRSFSEGRSPGMTGKGGAHQLRGADTGGGPRPVGFFGLSVPT
jgi:hypothetical protein